LNRVEKYNQALDLERDGGRPEDVLALLTEAANDGSADAQYALGSLYLHGKHVAKDIEKAVEFFEIAAKSMHSDALFDLAIAQENGEVNKASVDEAFRNYLLSAIAGDRGAIFELARCYFYGIGVDKDERIYNILMEASEHFNGRDYGVDDSL
jgi:uncharacterized protein